MASLTGSANSSTRSSSENLKFNDTAALDTKVCNLKVSSTSGSPNAKPRRALSEVPVNTQQTKELSEISGRVRREDSELTLQSFRKRKIYRDQEEENPTTKVKARKTSKTSDEEPQEEKILWKDLDANERKDVCMVTEYTNEIFSHLYKREMETLPSHNYLTDTKSKHNLRPSMRAILIDWLVEVHEKFQCYPETLFLTINIMDRFLSMNKVTLSKLQLLAVTALFIAAKFEEVNLPKLSDYAYITDGAATKNDIKNAEMFMLSSLEFNIGWPNPMNFLRRISKADNYDFQTRSIAKFLLECIMCYHKFIHLKPSTMSAMAMYVAKQITSTHNKKNLWDETFKHYSGGIDPYADAEFQSYCKDLIKEIASPTTKLDSLYLKFKKPKNGAMYYKVFQWCQNQVETDESLNSLFSL
ncbi:hypothetical protein HG535_0F01410 [Zygotorulaspora mrakii]|uniref:Uncharacterized protein n=1 Tax=Zygotorulaspora mrakii TaxID=42260 RepID=A0A7H9B4W1_ZYGMR|nr:uncharacterized protein HG535_0F01410 [Zygotorulaspora mrakii]QLG73630.1 hypothetical protein HG535_0F01410 [Zygotorulaspora mrakii]